VASVPDAPDGAQPTSPAVLSTLLVSGELTVEGRLVTASNATFYATVAVDDVRHACVYKPVAGERPLWDFPDGTLAQREVAAYAVSEATGWGVVPETVLRDGPYGPGMCQRWVDTVDPDGTGAGGPDLVDVVPPERVAPGYLRILAATDPESPEDRQVLLVHADDPRLRRMALLDVVLNNADRKGGHILPTADGAVFGVDHGVCFHEDDKLRTVLWGFAGRRIDEAERVALEHVRTALDGDLGTRLGELLTIAEVGATRARVEGLLTSGRFPRPGRRWPVIPWPAF
jgi:uncharacterized repeat protein (TIGR03843 family)